MDVLFHLVFPFSIESPIGMLPREAEPIPQDIIYQMEPQINSGVEIVDDAVNLILPSVTSPE